MFVQPIVGASFPSRFPVRAVHAVSSQCNTSFTPQFADASLLPSHRRSLRLVPLPLPSAQVHLLFGLLHPRVVACCRLCARVGVAPRERLHRSRRLGPCAREPRADVRHLARRSRVLRARLLAQRAPGGHPRTHQLDLSARSTHADHASLCSSLSPRLRPPSCQIPQALVLDLSPTPLQNSANAWLGRQTHAANVVGYLVGYLDLGHSPLLRWLGGGQFRKLAVVSCAFMLATVVVTCWTQEEDARPEMRTGESAWQKIRGVGRDVLSNIRTLPRPVRRVCYGTSTLPSISELSGARKPEAEPFPVALAVQFFAWSGFFPFLFYSCASLSLGQAGACTDEAPTGLPTSPRRSTLLSLAGRPLLPPTRRLVSAPSRS